MPLSPEFADAPRLSQQEAERGLEAVARWLEADAVRYDAASDKEAADDKRALAEAIRGLAQGNGSADLRDETVNIIRMTKKPDGDRLISYLESLDLE